jgi:pimeloyl-ACP methyl ester carboxylesterase
MAAAPRIRYTTCGDIDLAYQVFGDGPHDLLMFPGNSIPIDCIDAEPAMARFQRRLASFCRVIRFDPRGIGLSSHLPASSAIGPQYWAEDALAVLDAIGCDQVSVFAPSFSSLTGLVLAGDHPDRVHSVILVNGSARVLWAPDYPPGVPSDLAAPFMGVAMEPDAVDQGFDALAIIAPSVAGDDAFRAWWDHSGHRAATPTVARAVASVITQSDVRDRLPRITMPTLIMHRVDNLFVNIAHGRYLAEHMPGARFVELAGSDTLYWVGDTEPMLDEIEEFLTGARVAAKAEASEVLVSSTVRDIVTGSAREFVDRGQHELKGVPGSWRLYALRRPQPAGRR